MTAADYAAIAVAPVLIFFMISSLANFLMLVFYQGQYPLRVAWIVLMFTMGFVGIARIAIEQNRAYSLGYAAVLGVAGAILTGEIDGVDAAVLVFCKTDIPLFEGRYCACSVDGLTIYFYPFPHFFQEHIGLIMPLT